MTEKKKIIAGISIDKESTILQVLKKMDELRKKLLLVRDGNLFYSLISIGDIQRAIIKGHSLSDEISQILRDEITVCHEGDSPVKIKSEMLKHRAEFMPVVNQGNIITDVIFWEDVFGDNRSDYMDKLDLSVVIMAGGRGTRLKPLTNIIPKPLVPLGDKTILEMIIESFARVGMKKFYLMVNYKANLIENYLNELEDKNYVTEFILEDEPLGTAGSLSLLRGKIKDTFFVSNCDIIVDQDYSEIYKFHKENKNELTIVGALKHHSISYGTIEMEEGGILKELIEKPEISYLINSGLYILEPELISEVPSNRLFHITELIENIRKRNGRVGVFPVSEMSWMDIGDWEQFNNSQHAVSNRSSKLI